MSDLLAAGIDWVTAVVDKALTAYGINPVVHSLLIDGVFAGVGSVLSFLPIIVVLFFFLSILEDTGYMARIAFVMDKLLRKIGLSGRSIGAASGWLWLYRSCRYGNAYPFLGQRQTHDDSAYAVYERSAKIPIYAVFAAAFFPQRAALVMIGLYAAGMLVGILMALLIGKTVFRGNPVPFVMELPNYRFPSAKSVFLLMWDKAKDFLQRAFTIIFVATVLIWFLQSFDSRLNVVADSADSLLAMMGHWLAPVFAPLGFDDWRIPTALITGFSAKEAVVSTLGVLTGTSMETLGTALTGLFTPLSAISFLVFTLLYTPCMAAIAAVKRELGSGVLAGCVVVLQCVVAWAAAFLVYQGLGLLF